MTWSILARDAATGALGAALATQALINPMYAVQGMPRLRDNQPPESVIAALLASDAGRTTRQIHILDHAGRMAAHTGADCVGWCGSVSGVDVSVAGNMLAGPDVVSSTLAAFAAATGPLAARFAGRRQSLRGVRPGGHRRRGSIAMTSASAPAGRLASSQAPVRTEA